MQKWAESWVRPFLLDDTLVRIHLSKTIVANTTTTETAKQKNVLLHNKITVGVHNVDLQTPQIPRRHWQHRWTSCSAKLKRDTVPPPGWRWGLGEH